MWLLSVFVILPIIEIALFIIVGDAIGVLPVLALVLLSAATGIMVIRNQGARAAMDVQRAMNEMRDPAAPMANGALVMIGGVMMILPGFFTSSIGVLMLVPAVRTFLLGRMRARADAARRRAGAGKFGGRPPYGAPHRQGDDVIDGEYSVQNDPPAPVREGLTDGTDKPGQDPDRPSSGWTRH